MSDTFTFVKGRLPVLISMPHNGEAIPSAIAANMTEKALQVPDTDWYKDKLYDFAESLGVSVLKPHNNRYVIDLNRDPNGVDLYPGANSTELCPTTAFDSSPLYLEGKQPTDEEIQERIASYWQPYHQQIARTLAEMKAEFGCAVLLEAHSILSHVPRFFEGQLPDFNFGTANGESCAPELMALIESLDFAPYSKVANGRFKGGFITRHYGNPTENIHAVQLELSQATYMNEPHNEYNQAKAAQVKPKLKNLVEALIKFGQQVETK
ncbi:N-formylglutamate deformylase [Thalassotalea fusca]